MPAPPKQTPGVISIFELYSLDELKARLRWSDASLRSAKRQGLLVLAHGKRRYVAGRDVARFLRNRQA